MVAVQPVQEQRVVLRNVSWETYERLLWEHADSSVPRFTYDGGELEIVSPLPRHERCKRVFELVVPIVAREMGVSVYGLGSATFRRREFRRGTEPDSCFYLGNRDRVRGKDRIDLRVDPPPDLVIEIDMTNPSISKLPIYAQFGVPEVWRYDGEQLQVLLLGDEGYTQSTRSAALPQVTDAALASLMREVETLDDVEVMDSARAWARWLASG